MKELKTIDPLVIIDVCNQLEALDGGADFIREYKLDRLDYTWKYLDDVADALYGYGYKDQAQQIRDAMDATKSNQGKSTEQLNQDMYKALADICLNYHQNGIEVTKEDMKKAFDWSIIRLFDEEYTETFNEDVGPEETESFDDKKSIIDEAKEASEVIFDEAGWTYTSIGSAEYEVTIPEDDLYQVGETNYIRAFWDAFSDWRKVAVPGVSIPVDIKVDVVGEEEGFITFAYSILA